LKGIKPKEFAIDMKLTITGYSTALFSTWYFIEELGLLFDAGDGLTAALLQKARKIENVFISHADRDHLTGLLQLNQLNAREGFPKIFFPFNSGSFPAIESFSKKFDPHLKGTAWQAIKAAEHIRIKDNMYVQSIRNNHVASEQTVFKSLGFQVYQSKTKLKKEYLDLPQDKLLQLMNEKGKENMMESIRTNIITYSGDTPIEDYATWDNTEILIHEATFLGKNEQDNLNTHGNKHSNLEDVLKMVAELNIDKLILGHFSSRYSAMEIDSKIRSLCKELMIKIPVYRVLPGQIHRDILNEEPVYPL
jgi:ribonuclease Z